MSSLRRPGGGWGGPSTHGFLRGYSAPAAVTGTGEMELSDTASHPEGAQGPHEEAGQLQTRAQRVAKAAARAENSRQQPSWGQPPHEGSPPDESSRTSGRQRQAVETVRRQKQEGTQPRPW